jgi:outer membrane lipoprotein-sorting protein
MRILRTISALGIMLSAGLTGCYKTVKLVEKTQAPSMFLTAPLEVMEKQVSDRDEAIKTLNASVEVRATTGGGKEGKQTVYVTVKGYIFVRKPHDLRVLLQVPVLGSRAVDMVSNGDEFTLMYATPTKGTVWAQGKNTVMTPSANGLENLRPPVFFDSLLVPGVTADDFVARTESTRIVRTNDGRKQIAVEEPDYDLTIAEPVSAGSKILHTKRVLHINRIDMLPFQQDIYDNDGRVVTSASYENYQPYDGIMFPSVITINRPRDEYSLRITIAKLKLNGQLDDDQFELKIPAGVTVRKMQ